MIRITRRHTASAIFLCGLIGTGAIDAGAVANASFPASVKPGTVVIIATRTVTPRIQRTVGFNGYATYTFRAPKGRRILSASARISGAQAHAVVIRRRTIARNRTRYTVSLVFPGEQGNPGKLVVRLGTVR